MMRPDPGDNDLSGIFTPVTSMLILIQMVLYVALLGYFIHSLGIILGIVVASLVDAAIVGVAFVVGIRLLEARA